MGCKIFSAILAINFIASFASILGCLYLPSAANPSASYLVAYITTSILSVNTVITLLCFIVERCCCCFVRSKNTCKCGHVCHKDHCPSTGSRDVCHNCSHSASNHKARCTGMKRIIRDFREEQYTAVETVETGRMIEKQVPRPFKVKMPRTSRVRSVMVPSSTAWMYSGVVSSTRMSYAPSLTSMLIREEESSESEDDAGSTETELIPETVEQTVVRTRKIPIYETVQCTCIQFNSGYTCGCVKCECYTCESGSDRLHAKYSAWIKYTYCTFVFLTVPTVCIVYVWALQE